MTTAPEVRWRRLRAELGAWRKYPKDAVVTLRAERESFRSLMLSELAALADDPDRLQEDAPFFMHVHLLALLAEWREAAAWPHLARLLRRLDQKRYEAIYNFEGGEYLVPLIATLMPTDAAALDEMQALLETPEISVWLRGDVLGALCMRADKSVLPRAELIPRLRRALAAERAFQLARDAEARDEILATYMLSSLANLGDAESIPLVQPLFDEGLIDSQFWGGPDVYTACMRGEKIWPDNSPQDWVDDAVVFVKQHFYRSKEKKAKRETPHPGDKAAQLKLGRNDPCPCGSGKKYKKCCGA
jgi:hypothetical protein